MNWKLLLAAAAIGLAVPGGAAAQDPGADARIGHMQLMAEDVLRDDPFGDIDVAAALDEEGKIGDWAMALDANQRAELSERCRVIGENAGGYDQPAHDFCTAWLAWDQEHNPQR